MPNLTAEVFENKNQRIHSSTARCLSVQWGLVICPRGGEVLVPRAPKRNMIKLHFRDKLAPIRPLDRAETAILPITQLDRKAPPSPSSRDTYCCTSMLRVQRLSASLG